MSNNVHSPAISIRHAALERFDPDSSFKVVCPTCKEGLLLVMRNDRYEVVDRDMCVSCGQHYFYEDETIAGEPVVPWAVQQKPSLWERIGKDEDL